MAGKKPIQLKTLLERGGGRLAALARRGRRVAELAAVVRAAVPATLRPHVVAVNWRDQTLIVFADSPAWASRLRFFGEDIGEALHSHTRVRPLAVRFRVAPDRRARDGNDPR